MFNLKQYEKEDFYYFYIPVLHGNGGYTAFQSMIRIWFFIGLIEILDILYFSAYENFSEIPPFLWGFIVISGITVIINLAFILLMSGKSEVSAAFQGFLSFVMFGLSMMFMILIVSFYELPLDYFFGFLNTRIEMLQGLNWACLFLSVLGALSFLMGSIFYAGKLKRGETIKESQEVKKNLVSNYVWMLLTPIISSITFGIIMIMDNGGVRSWYFAVLLGIFAGSVILFKAPFYFVVYYMKKKFPETYREYDEKGNVAPAFEASYLEFLGVSDTLEESEDYDEFADYHHYDERNKYNKYSKQKNNSED